MEYQITDRFPTEAKYQKRVVAVFVQGQAWQFKDWEDAFKGAKSGNLVELFNKIRGFYIRYSDEKVPDVVKGWNVKVCIRSENSVSLAPKSLPSKKMWQFRKIFGLNQVLTVEKEARHRDEAVVREFWDLLDSFLTKNHSQLNF